MSRLLDVLHKVGDTTVIDGASYTYDNAVNRVSKSNYLDNSAEQYVYDDLYQLTQVTRNNAVSETYTYDKVGNRLSSLGVPTYSYNSSNQLTSSSDGVAYAYDDNGNTLSKADGAGLTQYGWDYENRLTSVTLPGGPVVSFKYDPFGRRIYKSSTSGTSVFAYDGDNLVEETNSSGTAVARYSDGLNIDEPLAMLRSSATSYYHADGLGSVTSLSNTSGAIAQTYTFDSFGNQTGSSGSLTNPFRYTARELDTETSLYYYRARYYDPQIGRFVSEDPIEFKGGIDFYAYVRNRPTALLDPTGTCPPGPCTPPPVFDTLSAYLVTCPCWYKGDTEKICQCIGFPLGVDVTPGSEFMKQCQSCYEGQKSPRAVCKCACTLMGNSKAKCDLMCNTLPDKWPEKK